MAYIQDSDIRDMLAKQFTASFSTYHTAVDNHIKEIIAEERLENDDLAVDGSGYISNTFLKRYAVNWFCMELFLDKMGINDNALADEEKYMVKFEVYRKKVDNMRKSIKIILLIFYLFQITLITASVNLRYDPVKCYLFDSLFLVKHFLV